MQAVHPGAGSQAQNQKAICLVSHKATLTVLVSVQVGPPFLSCACFFRLKWLPKEAFHRVLCLPVSSSGCHPPDLELSCPVGLIADVGLSLTQHLSADQLQFPHLAPSASAWDPRMGVGMWMVVAIASPS